MKVTFISLGILWAIFAAGCTEPLTTDYGVTSQQRQSINGVVLLESVLAERTNLMRRGRLTPGLLADEDLDVIFFLDRRGDSPEPEAIDRLLNWLYAESGRSLVVLMRDGSTSAALCRHWMREIEEDIAQRDQVKDAVAIQALRAQYETYEQRLAKERTADNVYRSSLAQWSGAFTSAYFLHEDGAVPRLKDLELPGSQTVLEDPNYPLQGRAAWTDWAAVSLPILNPSFEIEGGEPLFQVFDEQRDRWHTIATTYASNSTWGEPGRLVLWTTAQPFLDGAMPSIAHRQLLEGMVDELVYFHAQNSYDDEMKLAWIREAGYSDSNSEEQFNMLSMVFTRMPLALFSWHLLALLLIYLLWKNRWLGRRGDLLDPSHQQFRQHMLSLAQHLSRRADVDTASTAIADYRRIPPAPKHSDVYDALNHLNQQARQHSSQGGHRD